MRKDNINYERLKKTRRGGQGEGGRGKGERGSRRMEQRTSVAVPRSINKGPGKWTRDVPRHEFWRHRNDSGDTRDEALGSALPACGCVGRLIAVVHNLFRLRATYRSLKPFGGQTGVTTEVSLSAFMKMMWTVKHMA